MFSRRSFSLCAVVVSTLFAGSASHEAIAAKDIASQIGISSVALVTAGCPTENDCLLVKWNTPLQVRPQPRTGFLVTGRLTCESGQLNTPDVTINDGAARSHQFKFFHSCSGGIKSADVSVSSFKRGIDNEVVIVSQASKTQTFQP